MTYPAQYYYPPRAVPTSSAAVASLVFGLLGFILAGASLVAIESLSAMFALAAAYVLLTVAIVCGHIARDKIRRTGQAGSGAAVAGLILGYVALIPMLLAVVLAIIGGIAAA